MMRAIGARRRQIAAVYLRTTLLLGGAAALVGAALGILVSSLLAGYFGSMFWAVDVPFGVDPAVLAVSLLVGLLAPPLAALPAIGRGLRVDLRDALEASGSTVGGQGAIDHALRRARFLPRSMQIGLRNVGRRKRRSLATALIVALAVGNLLAVLGAGRRRHRGEPPLVGQPPGGPADLDRRARPLRRRGRAHDPHDPRGGRGRAGAQGLGGAGRPRGLRLGPRAGPPPRLPAGRRPLVHRRRGTGRGRRSPSSSATSPSSSASRWATGWRSRPRPGRRTSTSSASPTTSRRRGRRLCPADDGAGPDRAARRGQRLLGPGRQPGPGLRRPHHDPGGGPVGGPRLRGRHRGHLRRRAGRGGGEPLPDDHDRGCWASSSWP